MFHLKELPRTPFVNHVAHLLGTKPKTWVARTAYDPTRQDSRRLHFVSGVSEFGFNFGTLKPGDSLEFGIEGQPTRAYAVFIKRPNLIVVCPDGLSAMRLAGALRARDAATIEALRPYVRGEKTGAIAAIPMPHVYATETNGVRGTLVLEAETTPAPAPAEPPAPVGAAPAEAATWPEPVEPLRTPPQASHGYYFGCISAAHLRAVEVKAAKAGISEEELLKICRVYLGVPEPLQVRRRQVKRLLDELIPAHAAPENGLHTYRLRKPGEDAFAGVRRFARLDGLF